jgi:5-methyltetrahydrofolate--homocysteine methyltransferase
MDAAMADLEDLFRSKKKLYLLDGAVGTELYQHGCPQDVCIEKWALDHPEVVATLHRQYIDSGADMVYTATFGANRIRLEQFGMAETAKSLNEKLAVVARESVSDDALVAGCIGPIGVTPTAVSKEVLRNTFREQIEGLIAGGVDALVIETMRFFAEAETALQAAKDFCDLPVMVSFAFDDNGATQDRITVETVCERLQKLGAAAVGCNCSPEPSRMTDVIARMRKVTKLPLLAKPSAGIPTRQNDTLVYPYSPQDFVVFCREIVDAGAAMLGGCCGTTAEYIALLNKELVKPLNQAMSDGSRYEG